MKQAERKRYFLNLRQSMGKKEYREMCRKYRCALTLGRNCGTRIMQSARDLERKRRGVSAQDLDY